jgi:hypothetical protein
MTRIAWLAAIGFCLAVVGQDQPRFRAGVDVVAVHVSVRSGGRPVTGLTAGDFEVFDNRVRQQIDDVAVEHLPIDATLVVDVSNAAIASGQAPALMADLKGVAALLDPADRLRMLADGTYIVESVPSRSLGAPWSVDALPSGGGAAPGDAVALALMRPTPPDRRHLVVAFTVGASYFNVLDDEVLPRLAEQSDAVLHVVGGPIWTGGKVNVGRQQKSVRLLPLEEAADRTGGATHASGRGLLEAFKEIVGDFRRSYLLRYTPRGVPLGGWHDIEVRLVKPGSAKYTMRARKGYFR